MSGSRKAIWAVVGALVLFSTLAGAGGLAMSLYANHRQKAQPQTTPVAKSDLARFAVGPLASLETPSELKTAPEYMFRDRNDTAVRFSTFEGKVVVVNLWAMWCAPCRTEMPTLAQLARSYQRNEDLIVLPINVDASPDALADAKFERNPRWVSLIFMGLIIIFISFALARFVIGSLVNETI